MTILKFSLHSSCKSNDRAVRSRYWALFFRELWFSFAFFYDSEKKLLIELENMFC